MNIKCKDIQTSLRGKRVLLIVDIFLTPITNYILNHIVGLIRRGAKVNILASKIDFRNESKLIEKYSLYDQVVEHRINSYGRIFVDLIATLLNSIVSIKLLKSIYLLIVDSYEFGMAYCVKSVSLLRYYRTYEFDIVHSHSLMKSYQYLFFKKVFGVPIVTTFHGLPTKNLQKLPKRKCKQVFLFGDLFLVNTKFAKKQLIALGCSKEKISIIPQSTDINFWNFRSETHIIAPQLNILSVCRLSYDKGLKYLIKAIAELKKTFPYIKCQIIGSGPQHNELAALIEKLALEGTVSLCGALGVDKVKEKFMLADIFILPSVSALNANFHEETQAVVIQEAQSCGIPVIATRVGGIPECNIQGQTALLIPDRDIKALVDGVNVLATNKSLCKKMAKNGRSHVEAYFSIDNIAEQMAKEYVKLCRR